MDLPNAVFKRFCQARGFIVPRRLAHCNRDPVDPVGLARAQRKGKAKGWSRAAGPPRGHWSPLWAVIPPLQVVQVFRGLASAAKDRSHTSRGGKRRAHVPLCVLAARAAKARRTANRRRSARRKASKANDCISAICACAPDGALLQTSQMQ